MSPEITITLTGSDLMDLRAQMLRLIKAIEAGVPVETDDGEWEGA